LPKRIDRSFVKEPVSCGLDELDIRYISLRIET